MKNNIGNNNMPYIKGLIYSCCANIFSRGGFYVRRLPKDQFLTFHQRPKFCEGVNFRMDSYSSEDIAIIMQGPLLSEDAFTYETVMLYRKMYPKAKVIISTWSDEDECQLKNIEQTGAYVVLSEKPAVPGLNNENMQKTTVLAGIEIAKRLSCRYVLKTRTDQRMYAENVLEYCKDLLSVFPLRIRTKASNRLVVSSLGSVTKICYGLSDMFVFGMIEDVERYFSPPDDIRIGRDKQLEEIGALAYSQQRTGDRRFMTFYIEECGHLLEWTLDNSDYYRNELFIVIDVESLDLYWPKYEPHTEYRWRRYSDAIVKQVSFRDWLIGQIK